MVTLSGCSGEPATPDQGLDGPDPTPTGTLEAHLPASPGPFEPTFLRPVEGSELDPALIADVDTCVECHAEIVGQWRSSAHALASFNNPYYRAAVDIFREDAGFERSRFCGGCHDVALLPGGELDRPVAPENALAHVGIACGVCHSVQTAHVDGNASIALTGDPIPLPVEGDDESLAQHLARVGPEALRSDELCISCHRGFLDERTGHPMFLIGMDDGTAWQRSAYAGPSVARIDEELPRQRCVDCHMPAQDGLRSHRFPGAQTALAEATGDPAQVDAVTAMLRSAVRVDIAAIRHGDGRVSLPAEAAAVSPGERVAIDVVVRNVGVGHRFPAGVVDTQDSWLELVVEGADGALIAEAGTAHERGEADDPTAHIFKAQPVRAEGQPGLLHNVFDFRAIAWNHTIDSRDAAVVRYGLTLPEDLAAESLPLTVTARVRHRRHGRDLHEAACAASRDPVGRAFDETAGRLTGIRVDGCAPQPVTDLASRAIQLGDGVGGVGGGPTAQAAGGTGQSPESSPPGSSTAALPPLWQRLYEHGLGLLHQVQERLDEARPSLDRALELVTQEGTPRQRAMVVLALAKLEGRQGRTDVAMARFDEAEALWPGDAAVPYQRGLALAQVWRWEEAAEAFQLAVQRAPDSDQAWTQLAIALGALARDRESLAAAQRGLELQPRSASLLLSQSLALTALHAPEPLVSLARRAYLRYRPYDEAPGIRYACFRQVEGCAQERLPVHTHEMRVHQPDGSGPSPTHASP